MHKIQTQRLLLRKVLIEDMEDIYQYCKNPAVGINAGWHYHRNRKETLDIMNNMFIGKKWFYSIVLNEKVIGNIGIINDPKRLNKNAKMIGYSLNENYWNKGYMTEAVSAVLNKVFSKSDIEIITAYCYPDNEGSKKVLIKNNFTYEGTLRFAEKIYTKILKDNECWSITREEFLKKNTLFIK